MNIIENISMVLESHDSYIEEGVNLENVLSGSISTINMTLIGAATGPASSGLFDQIVESLTVTQKQEIVEHQQIKQLKFANPSVYSKITTALK